MINKNTPRHVRKQSAPERIKDALSNLSKEDPLILLLVIISPCLLAFVILAVFVGINTAHFWNFLNDVTPAEIEKIEVQRIDINGIGISDPITVTDQAAIADFISAIRTVQEESSKPFNTENETKVTIWLNNRHTIEFECFTIQGSGNNVFVQYIWLKPNIYSFGECNVHFPEPEFYNWLLSIGVSLE